MQTSESIDQLSVALSKVQAVLEGAKKDSLNPFHKSRYADLTSVWKAIREPLTAHGFSVVQSLGSTEQGWPTITTMLLHVSGQWIRDTLTMKPKEDTPQGVGSAITYGRRYALSALVGVSPEDDDGEAATGRGSRPATQKTMSAGDVRAAFQAPARPPVTAGNIVTPASSPARS